MITASTAQAATILGIDTATSDVAVALTRGPEVLFEARIQAGPDRRPLHSAALLEQVAAAVRAGGGWESIEAIAVGAGPGTFTGLRIGIATARALAQARDLDLAAVSSLAAIARGIEAHGRPRLAVIDARRGEVFAALLDSSETPLWPPFVASPKALGERIGELGESTIAAGDGSLRFRPELEAAGAEVPPDADPVHRMAARHVCALADGAPRVRPEQVSPIYLRRPDAEVWREQQQHGARGGDRGA